jgi:hypothetical protein
MSTKEKTTKTAEIKPNEKPLTNAPLIYCGPTIKGVAKQYTVFSEGLPSAVKMLIKKCPMVNALIVPVDDFAAIKKALGTKDSAESFIYKQIIKTLKGGNN